jgi:hypothetical protein
VSRKSGTPEAAEHARKCLKRGLPQRLSALRLSPWARPRAKRCAAASAIGRDPAGLAQGLAGLKHTLIALLAS